MDIILNYLVNHIYKESGESLKESLIVLDKMFEDNMIDENTLVKLNIDGSELSLKDFLLNKYQSTPVSEILDLFTKNNIENDMSNEDAYITILNMLRTIRMEYIPHKIDEVLSSFYSLKIPPEKIINYIKEFKNNDFEQDKNPDLFFKIILENDKNIKLVENVLLNYLSSETIKNALKDYISRNYISLTFSNAEKGVKLCNAYPELRTIEVDKKGVNITATNFIEELILNTPSKINELILTDEEKEHLINLYFKERVEVITPSLRNAEDILKSRKDWFKSMCGQIDIISVLTRSSPHGVASILNQLRKEKDLKEYLSERKENLLVEYITNDGGRIVKSNYNKIIKNFPDLLKRKNEKGVLNILCNNTKLISVLDDEKMELFKSLPSTILMTSEENELLRWIDNESFISFDLSYNSVEKSKDIYKLFFSCIDSNFGKEKTNDKVIEAINKIKMQYEITKLMWQRNSTHFEIGINKEIIHVIENSGLKAKDLENMIAIENLYLNGYLPENYIANKKAEEEKKILLDSVFINEEILTSKKRM